MIDDKPIKKMTFKRNLTRKDFDFMRDTLGLNIIEEGIRHVMVQFENQLDYLAFATAKDIHQHKATVISS